MDAGRQTCRDAHNEAEINIPHVVFWTVYGIDEQPTVFLIAGIEDFRRTFPKADQPSGKRKDE